MKKFFKDWLDNWPDPFSRLRCYPGDNFVQIAETVVGHLPAPLRRQSAPKLDLKPGLGSIRVTEEAPSHSDSVIGRGKPCSGTHGR